MTDETRRAGGESRSPSRVAPDGPARSAAPKLRHLLSKVGGTLWIARKEAEAELDALVAEHGRYRDALKQVADPSYVGSYSDAEVVNIYRSWAHNALLIREAVS